MSDNIKLIIEIPKPMYENVQNGTYCGTLYKELKNGTPLDDLKADIKAYSIIKQNPIANRRKVGADSIEVWKAKIIEEEHIKELLDSVKAEIDKAQEPYMTSTAYDEGVRFGLMLAYQFLDSIGKESEDT